MQQRDFVEKQIEAMGRFLAGLFTKMNLPDANEATKADEAAHMLKAELGYTPEEILAVPETDFVKGLLATGSFNDANLEKLADVLVLLGEKQQDRRLYTRALYIYEHLEKQSGEYSVARNMKINRLRVINS